MKAIWNKLVSAFRSLLAGTRQLFYVVWTQSKKEIADILNDSKLQQLALAAVTNAARAKLGGDAAWEQAFAEFKEAASAAGWKLGTAMLEAVLQNVYVVFKFNGGLAAIDGAAEETAA